MGGAPLSKAVCRKALALGIDLCSVYGMAETGPMLTAALLKPDMTDWDVDRQVDVRCRTGLPTPMAPWLTQGYARNPEKSEALWKDGWMHTGDIGFIDTEGYLHITDRIQDAIKSGGEWIDTMALEDMIADHEAVSEAAVTAIPDEKYGERPLAFVVLKAGHQGRVTEEDLRSFLLARVTESGLPKSGVPDKIAFVDTIPTTSVGKISRKQLQRRFSPTIDLDEAP